MIYALFFLSTLALTQATSIEEDWETFKASFGKKYANAIEERTRFKNFIENLRTVTLRNMAERLSNGTAVHGVTQFSDLSQAEFEYGYLTATPPKDLGDVLPSPHNQEPVATMGLVDWTGKKTTAVKDQGYCGSCWAFSATEQIESDAIRLLGLTYTLSPAQLTQCDTRSSGCNGGWPLWAMNYVRTAGGIETLANYPYSSTIYSGKTGTCAANPSLYNTVTVSSTYQLSGEANMASWLQANGPISICIDATTWNSYTSGIVSSCGTSINHAVQAVGVDAVTGGYWKVRNSWSTGWGEAGFIRLSYGKNMCGITYQPVYSAVTKK